jgi:hypothetical protein
MPELLRCILADGPWTAPQKKSPARNPGRAINNKEERKKRRQPRQAQLRLL